MNGQKQKSFEAQKRAFLMDELQRTRTVMRIRTVLSIALSAAAIFLTEYLSSQFHAIFFLLWLPSIGLALFSKKTKLRYAVFMGSATTLASLKLMRKTMYTTQNLLILFVAWILAVGSFLLIELARKKYRNAFKTAFVPEALAQIFSNVDYEPENGISQQVIANTKMMYTGDRFRSEDYVSAQYKDVGFEQSDIWIERKTHEDRDFHGEKKVKTTKYTTIFQGRWLIFDFNKQFRSKLQIIQKGFRNTKRKSFFRKSASLLQPVELESTGFHKEFKVFAQNEHEAFYIITPAFMERMQKLTARNKGKKMMFCFVGQRLHIAIDDNKDSFEPPSVFKRIDEEQVKQTLREEIEVITQFVDELRLDNNLFVKVD